MRANRVGDVRDRDRVDSFVRRSSFNEYLIIQIVVVLAHEDVDVAHYL